MSDLPGRGSFQTVSETPSSFPFSPGKWEPGYAYAASEDAGQTLPSVYDLCLHLMYGTKGSTKPEAHPEPVRLYMLNICARSFRCPFSLPANCIVTCSDMLSSSSPGFIHILLEAAESCFTHYSLFTGPSILYTVADHVPPSRWKEFVRRLGLSDHDLERIEMEHRCFRDAQYEMLRQWKLQMSHAATVEHICCVLNQMELSGCSEAIQEALLNQSSQPCSFHIHH